MASRIEIRIYGLVQGVTFRYSTLRTARDLGLAGFVRNESDGSVLIVAEGQRDKLGELLTWTKQGPVWSQVERVDHFFGKPTGEFEDFTIR